MYLMYVDESGDIGLNNSPTSHFVLTGLVLHESQWRSCITQLIAFRKAIKSTYGLPQKAEIHASEYMRYAPVPGMPRYVRIAILRNLIDEIAKMNFVSITNVVVSKAGKPAGYDVFLNAWQALFQRFENTLKYGNFPGGFRNDQGIVLTDATDGRKLQKLIRKMAVFNPIPNQHWAGPGARNLPILRVIEDPCPKDSKESYFIQACDVIAYFVHQHFKANKLIKQVGAQHYIRRLQPVLNLKASPGNALGIVQL